MTVWKGRTCMVVDGKVLMSGKKAPADFDTSTNYPGGATWIEFDSSVRSIEQLADGRLCIHAAEGKQYVIEGDPHDGFEPKLLPPMPKGQKP